MQRLGRRTASEVRAGAHQSLIAHCSWPALRVYVCMGLKRIYIYSIIYRLIFILIIKHHRTTTEEYCVACQQNNIDFFYKYTFDYELFVSSNNQFCIRLYVMRIILVQPKPVFINQMAFGSAHLNICLLLCTIAIFILYTL